MRHDLPNFTKYLTLLKLYCKSTKVKLIKHSGETFYLAGTRIIKYNCDLSEAETISSILHELGHIMDEFSLKPTKRYRLIAAYNKVYTSKVTKAQKEIVILAEKKAWANGRVIAKLLGIPLGRWYPTYMKKCLRSYQRIKYV